MHQDDPTNTLQPVGAQAAVSRRAEARRRSSALAAMLGILFAAEAIGADVQPAIERVDLPTLRIRDVQVRADRGGLEISGHLQKTPAGHIARHRLGRFPVRGHLHLKALDASARILADTVIMEYGPSARPGVATFAGRLDRSPPEVTRVRLIYHQGPVEQAGRDAG